jgi:multidrug efflux pump subunit AcrA (membrane-fusion protein)
MKHATSDRTEGLRQLDIRAPVRLGLVAIAIAFLAGVSAVLIEFDQGPVVTASGNTRADPEVLRHSAGGTIARIHVVSGATVTAGALLVSLDTRALDSQIASLRLLSNATTMKLTAVRQMAAALAAVGQAGAQSDGVRTRLAGLEQEVAETETEAIGVQTRIMLAEQERTRTDIRAPIAGRVLDFAGHAEGSKVAPNSAVARILPRADQLLLDVRWPSPTSPKAGQTTKVWVDGPWAALPTLNTVYVGRIDLAMSETSAAQPASTRVVVDIGGTDLMERSMNAGALRFHLQLVVVRQSMFAHLFAPMSRPAGVAVP